MSPRQKRRLRIIPREVRDAIKKDVNDAFVAASGSCEAGLSQRLWNGRADARHPIGDRPVDVVADLVERRVKRERLRELGVAWKNAGDRIIAYADTHYSDDSGQVA